MTFKTTTAILVAMAATLFLQGCSSVRPVSVKSAPPTSNALPKGPQSESTSDDDVKKAFITTLAGFRAEFSRGVPQAVDPAPAPLPGMSPAGSIRESELPAPSQTASLGSGSTISPSGATIPVFSPGDEAQAPAPPLEVKGDSVSLATDRLACTTCDISAAPAPEAPVVTAPEPKKSLPSAKTLAEAMKKTGYTVVFEDDEAKLRSADGLGIEYANAEELAREIENRTDLFCSSVDGTLMVSSIKEKTYAIAPFEKLMTKNVGGYLHHAKAEARVVDGVGQMIVKDDRIGHQKVKSSLDELKAEFFTAYKFRIETEKSGLFSGKGRQLASSGEVTPATSPMNIGEWSVGVKKQGDRLIIEVLNAKKMEQPATFIMDAERGGNASFSVKEAGKGEQVFVTVAK